MHPRPQRSAETSVTGRFSRTLKRVALKLGWAALIIALVAALGSLAKAQLQQVPSGTWAPMATIGTLPAGTAAAALADGRVVVAGGAVAGGASSKTVAIFDPATALWTNAGSMLTARTGHAAAVLPDGRVLIAGGTTEGGVSAGLEIFDPAVGMSVDAGVMTMPRTQLAAATLDDGRVLLVGGSDGTNPLATAEIFDPETGAVSAAGSMQVARWALSATTLIDGRVLAAGGADASGELASAEIFVPASGAFVPSAGLMNIGRSGHVAIRLPHNNAVLIAGGQSAGAAVSAAELYFSWNDSFNATGPMADARVAAVSLPIPQDGLAGVAGGIGVSSAEAYGFATVKTDKDDYAPGETVTITGTGWEPNELVTWTLEEVLIPPDGVKDGPFTFQTQADANGNFLDATWAPDWQDAGVLFHLTLVGSKSQAQAKFTDAIATTTTIASSLTPSTFGQSVTFTATVTAGGNPVTAGSVVIYDQTSEGSAGNCNNKRGTSIGSGPTVSGQFSASTNSLSVGPHLIRACYTGAGTGNTGTQDSGSVQLTQTVGRAASTTTFGAAPTPTYLGGNFTVGASNDSGGAITYSRVSGPCAFVSGAIFSTSGAGSCVVQANSAATTNYLASSAQQTVIIAKATATVTLSNLTQTYTGAALTPTATTNPAGRTIVWTNAPQTSAETYTVTATVNDSNYQGSASGTFVINKADATFDVKGWSGIYDGNAHGATGTATGVGGVDLSAGLNLGGSFTDVPGGTAHWTFAGGTNYNDKSGDVAIVINKADAIVTVNGYTGTYDAAAHGATGTATGVGGVDLSAGLNLGGSFTDVPGGTAHWTFAGGTNYNDQNGTAAIVINKANATVTVTGYTGTYDAAAHGASGTATGVGGVDLSASLNLGATFTDYPGGTASWTFTGGTNYNDQNGTAAIVINKANATVTVTGYTGTYDAAAHGASGTATGVGGVDLSASLNLGATFTDYPGGTAHWTFAGGTNYNDQNGTAAIVINKANATVTVTGYTGTYDAAAHGASGTATGVGGVDLSASLNLGGTFTDYPGGTAHWTFTGGTNYNNQNGTAAIVINKADQTITWPNPASIVYGTALSATQLNATVAGVAGGSAPGTLTYTPPAGTILGAGSNQALTVNAAETVNYKPASKTVAINVLYDWTGFLQPINDTAHQIGLALSRFKLGQTIPAKFVLKNAAGGVVQQATNPTFTRSQNLGACGETVAEEITLAESPTTVPVYLWDGSQYHYNWSTKGLTQGKYRIFANLADGTSQFVDICLSK